MLQNVPALILSLLLIAYLLLGLTQSLRALISFWRGEKFYPSYRSKLKRYLSGVVLYFVFLGLAWQILGAEIYMDKYDAFLAIYLLVLPWGFAIYFWRMVYHKEKS